MISFAEALALIARSVNALGSEAIPIQNAAGRVLAAPVIARIDAPRSAVSTMDGWAVRDQDMAGVGTNLRNIGTSFAGSSAALLVGAGDAVRIFTGAPMPVGADRVIIQENVEQRGDEIFVTQPYGAEKSCRAQASDFAAGDALLSAGNLLTPRALLAAAASDQAQVTVTKRPRISVISTGDELVAPGQALGQPGTIPESVGPAVAAFAETWGAEVISVVRGKDDLHALEVLAKQAVEASDLVIITGGASVGAKDFAKTMFVPLDMELLFSKVAVKPGKPVWLGRTTQAWVLGLPGNPTSAMVTARLFLAPLLCALTGQSQPPALVWRSLPLAGSIGANGERESFIRALWRDEGLVPVGNLDSGAQLPLAHSDWLIRVPAGQAAMVASEHVQALSF